MLYSHGSDSFSTILLAQSFCWLCLRPTDHMITRRPQQFWASWAEAEVSSFITDWGSVSKEIAGNGCHQETYSLAEERARGRQCGRQCTGDPYIQSGHTKEKVLPFLHWSERVATDQRRLHLGKRWLILLGHVEVKVLWNLQVEKSNRCILI